ncbi:isocitrate/isopropylmalate family dehydrogenase, partial [Streptococcus suis]
EPIHGSAPDIAGQGIANPVSMILSVAMMLEESFDLIQAGQGIRQAVEEVFAKGIFTKDLGGSASTKEITAAIIEQLERRSL